MTITAQRWLESSAVEPAVFERWPDYRAVLVAADGINIAALSTVADGLIGEATNLVAKFDPATPSDHVALWQAAYRDFGVKQRVARVSVDALTRRALSESGLPRINVLVDVYNAVSVLYQVPIGGEDLDHYEGAARLVIASGVEPFLTNANGERVTENPEPGEPIWIDDSGVTCRRWNWRQTTRTAIITTTTRAGFIIDSLDAPSHHGALEAAHHLAELIGTNLIRTIDSTD